MRPRRRFDQRPQEPTTRINDAIRVPQIRLIGADGEQIGKIISGYPKDKQVWLKAGDTLTTSIEKLGDLEFKLT